MVLSNEVVHPVITLWYTRWYTLSVGLDSVQALQNSVIETQISTQQSQPDMSNAS